MPARRRQQSAAAVQRFVIANSPDKHWDHPAGFYSASIRRHWKHDIVIPIGQIAFTMVSAENFTQTCLRRSVTTFVLPGGLRFRWTSSEWGSCLQSALSAAAPSRAQTRSLQTWIRRAPGFARYGWRGPTL